MRCIDRAGNEHYGRRVQTRPPAGEATRREQQRSDDVIHVPASVRFPVELVPPDGFDPVRLETWPRVEGRLEWVGGRLLYMPPCGEMQQATVADVVGVLIPWQRAHPEFSVGTNEAGMRLGEDSRGADAGVWRQRSALGLSPRAAGPRRRGRRPGRGRRHPPRESALVSRAGRSGRVDRASGRTRGDRRHFHRRDAAHDGRAASGASGASRGSSRRSRTSSGRYRRANYRVKGRHRRRSERAAMKIVVIGGSGLIGKKVVTNLRQRGHEVVAASPSSGVNTVTGEGLAQALAGARVVVDVANAPSWEDNAVLEFFETSGRNLLAAEASAGVGHHVALSVVGTDRLLASGYFRAKMAQEKLIKASPIPYTIVRATQFFEFVGGIAQSATEGQTVRLPPVLMQPIASDDVAAVVADVALAEPLNGTFELAGPEPIRQDDLVRQFLTATGDARTVITDPKALYYGIEVNDQSLTPGDHPRLGPTRFEDWLRHKAE